MVNHSHKEAVNKLLDNLSFIQVTGGSVDAQQLGNLANYGDEAVQLGAKSHDPANFLTF